MGDEAKIVVPESVLKKQKREAEWTLAKKEELVEQKKKNMKLICSRATQYAHEYADLEKETILLKREAKLKGGFYVEPEAKLLFIVKIRRSTNLDSWTPEQLKTMCFGGNSCAHIFFKQHGWTDGGKIEAKYTSRASELYMQILAKEVAKSAANDLVLPSSPVERKETPELPAIPKYHAIVTCTVKKHVGAKKIVKAGGLGARKLSSKSNESLYDQKPEEVHVL